MRSLIHLLLMLCLLAAPAASQEDPPTPVQPPAKPTAQRPNLILILSDDHRWDALGAAGNSAIHTPNLDRMARQGLYLREATIHVSQCPPSRATLLTGLPPHLHGIHSGQHQDPEVKRSGSLCRGATLPGELRELGYRTGHVGKWHLPVDPWECGFDEVMTWIPFGAADYLHPPTLSRGRSRESIRVEGYTQDVLTRDAVDFIERSAGKGRPFFLWAAYTAPHLPYGPNPAHVRKLYDGKEVGDLLPASFPKGQPTNPNWVEYYEAVSHLDEEVGEIYRALEKTGQAESTVVVFLGDNGYMMGERGIGLSGPAGKVVPYESSLRVPLIVTGLAGLTGERPEQVSSLDLPPTLLGLAGGEAPQTWAGRDFVSALRQGEGLEYAVSEWSDDQSARFGALAFQAIRSQRYKWIDWKDEERPDELYDLASDPREERNLASDPAMREVREELARRLADWRRRTEATPPG